jgi:hypothetical protein
MPLIDALTIPKHTSSKMNYRKQQTPTYSHARDLEGEASTKSSPSDDMITLLTLVLTRLQDSPHTWHKSQRPRPREPKGMSKPWPTEDSVSSTTRKSQRDTTNNLTPAASRRPVTGPGSQWIGMTRPVCTETSSSQTRVFRFASHTHSPRASSSHALFPTPSPRAHSVCFPCPKATPSSLQASR